MDDPLEHAWRAFVLDDAAARPPHHLEARVLAAVRRSAPHGRSTRRRALQGLLLTAAAVVLALVADRPVPVGRPFPRGTVAESSVAVPQGSEAEPPVAAATTSQARRLTTDAGGPLPHPAGDVLTLSADPILASEPLQLIRMRMPRGALRSMGVGLLEPDGGGLVEIDVLFGGDGLPRSIYPVRLVKE